MQWNLHCCMTRILYTTYSPLNHTPLLEQKFMLRYHCSTALAEVTMKRAFSGASEAPPAAKRKPTAASGHWSTQLLASMQDPEKVVKSDEMTVTIKDAYPKAVHHYLVLPKENIANLRSLNTSHIKLLRHMLRCGEQLEEELKSKNPSLRFRHGYHAVPSMARLHMHVISQDFDSACLKTKKHWNSFTSEFFKDAKDIIRILETNGKIDLDKEKYEALLKLPLKCHVCHAELPNMPKLKAHIQKHK